MQQNNQLRSENLFTIYSGVIETNSGFIKKYNPKRLAISINISESFFGFDECKWLPYFS